MTAADKKSKKKKSECLLFGHPDVTTVAKLGGKCYRANRPGNGKGKKGKPSDQHC